MEYRAKRSNEIFSKCWCSGELVGGRAAVGSQGETTKTQRTQRAQDNAEGYPFTTSHGPYWELKQKTLVEVILLYHFERVSGYSSMLSQTEKEPFCIARTLSRTQSSLHKSKYKQADITQKENSHATLMQHQTSLRSTDIWFNQILNQRTVILSGTINDKHVFIVYSSEG